MHRARKGDWTIPAALIAPAFIPVAAGMVRLGMLANGGPLSEQNARFFAAPLPAILHILGSTHYCLAGATFSLESQRNFELTMTSMQDVELRQSRDTGGPDCAADAGPHGKSGEARLSNAINAAGIGTWE